MDVSDWIAFGSMVIAAAAFIQSLMANRRSKKLDVQLKEYEVERNRKAEEDAKKADVEVNVIETGRNKCNLLRFYNKGNAEAHNINFDFQNDDEDKISLNIPKDFLPYPKLLPQQNFDVPYLCFNHRAHHSILITWEDDFGKNRKKEMVIDI